MKPLVSVIIPAYNIERFIRGAVDSALMQTYKPIEVIVTDDGSKDGTKAALEPYIEQGKVHYVYQQNKGIAGARNTAIRAAKGKYIALLDGDDLFLPEKIERQVAYLEAHPECDASYCGIWIFYDGKPDETFKLDYTYYSDEDVLPMLLRKQFINPTTLVIRREVFDKVGFFNEEIGYSEDFEFCLRLALKGGKITFLSDYLAMCRWRAGSTSYSMRSKINDRKAVDGILRRVRREMTPAQRKATGIDSVIFINRLKWGYVSLADKLPPLAWFHWWLQGKRLK